MRLLIAGGGTGGHLFPGIAVAEEFLARDPSNEVLFVGTERGIEARVLPRTGYRLETISAAGIRGKSRLSSLKGVGMLLYAYAQSRRILKEFRPDRVLGVGGYSSGPVVLAAGGMGIRRFIHEQNAIPGFTNKILARFVEKTFISLEESRPFFTGSATVLTGNPLRRQILDQVPEERPHNGDSREIRLLVFGGSAGAHSVNMAMCAALAHLVDIRDRLRITHQTGEADCAAVQAAYGDAGFRAEVVPFIDNMAAAYAAADLVVCRAGATTIAEVTAIGKACIFIPYPHAVDDHQRRNAEALLKRGAGYMLLERELSGESLARLIGDLAAAPDQLETTGLCARSLARLDAAKLIVDEMLKS